MFVYSVGLFWWFIYVVTPKGVERDVIQDTIAAASRITDARLRRMLVFKIVRVSPELKRERFGRRFEKEDVAVAPHRVVDVNHEPGHRSIKAGWIYKINILIVHVFFAVNRICMF